MDIQVQKQQQKRFGSEKLENGSEQYKANKLWPKINCGKIKQLENLRASSKQSNNLENTEINLEQAFKDRLDK